MAAGRQSADQVDLENADSLPGGSSAAGIDGVVAARWQRMAERWSPVGLRGARTDPGRRGAAVLVLVAVVAALAAGLAAWHSRPRPEAVPPPAVLSGPDPAVLSGPDRAVPTGPSASAASIVVAVTGKVRHPGVVTVPGGARVIDAVKAAGGPLPGADLGTLNLARKLTDGELVAVGVPGPAPVIAGDSGSGGAPAGGTTGPVDLNTATLAELDTLPGVGPVLAQRILDWRTAHGQFASVDQLADVPGIGESRMAQLRDLVRV
jgi:competence protein ComEA